MHIELTFYHYLLVITDGPEITLSWIRSVKEGANLTIQPYVRGNPEPVKFTWKKEGSDAVVFTDKNLFLENASREQGGVYIFEATSVRQRENNATEEVTGNASIIVEVKCKGISLELDIVLHQNY